MERLPEPFDVLVIKEPFNAELNEKIKDEVRALLRKDSGSGVWLSEAYNDLDMSAVGTSTMELVFDARVVEQLVNINSMYGLYTHVNNHSTVVKFYGNRQSSILHDDQAAFTVMSFIHDTPKSFEGGELILQIAGDIAYEQPIEDNMTVIFPSSYYVGINEVASSDGSGLYVATAYLFIES